MTETLHSMRGAKTGIPAELPRVERDPCPRCGVRSDHGCRHGVTKPLSVLVTA